MLTRRQILAGCFVAVWAGAVIASSPPVALAIGAFVTGVVWLSLRTPARPQQERRTMPDVAVAEVLGNEMRFDRRNGTMSTMLRMQTEPSNVLVLLDWLTETVDESNRALLSGLLPALTVGQLQDLVEALTQQWNETAGS